VPHAFLFGREIIKVGLVGGDLDRHSFGNGDAVALQADYLFGIVREQADFAHPQIRQNLRPDSIIAQIRFEAQSRIGIYGVAPVVLQFIGSDLVDQADAAPFLAHINNDALPRIADHSHRGVQLIAAVAAVGTENISGGAFRMHTNQNIVVRSYLSHYQSQMECIVNIVFINGQMEFPAVARGQFCRSRFMNQRFVAHTVFDQIGDGGDFQIVLMSEDFQIRHPRHRAIVLHHFANDASGC